MAQAVVIIWVLLIPLLVSCTDIFQRFAGKNSVENVLEARNYISILQQENRLEQIQHHKLLFAWTIVHFMQASTLDSDSNQRAYYLVMKALQLWPEIYGFWTLFVHFEVTFDEDTRALWASSIFRRDPSIDARAFGNALQIGIQNFPLCPGLNLLAGVAFLHRSRHPNPSLSPADQLADRTENLNCASFFSVFASSRLGSDFTSLKIKSQSILRLAQWLAQETFFAGEDSVDLGSADSEYTILNEDGIRSVCFGRLFSPSLIVGDDASNAGNIMKIVSGNLDHPPAPIKLALHIGCSNWDICSGRGWTVVDAMDNFSVFLVTTAANLKMFGRESVSQIYSAHTLEHISYALPSASPTHIPISSSLPAFGKQKPNSLAAQAHETCDLSHERSELRRSQPQPRGEGSCSGDGKYASLMEDMVYLHIPRTDKRDSVRGAFGEACETLVEWRRVLVPGISVLHVSVPDLGILARMFIQSSRTYLQKKVIMTIMYGGQHNVFDFHKIGFFYEFMARLLAAADFCEIERVESLDIFEDASKLRVFGELISLNVRAKVCVMDNDNAEQRIQRLENISCDGRLL